MSLWLDELVITDLPNFFFSKEQNDYDQNHFFLKIHIKQTKQRERARLKTSWVGCLLIQKHLHPVAHTQILKTAILSNAS